MSQSRIGAVFTRLTLLVLVVGGTGVLVGTLFLPTAVAMTDVVDTVDRDIFDVPPLPDAEFQPANSFVFAADGSQLAEINFEQNRLPVTLAQVPEVTRDAIIATEDATFWEHKGINHESMVRAAIANLRAGDITQGASTITQQLVKNLYIGIENADDSYDRKIREALWAIQLERKMSKDEILERYFNVAFFGNGVWGLGKAAERYFSKPVEELNLTESAMLAGLIRTPEGNNPITKPEAALARRNIVLDQMARHGYLSLAQAETAKAQPLGLDPKDPTPPVEPRWVNYVTRLLTEEDVAEALGSQVDALNAMGADFEERRNSVFQGGLRIYTTIEPSYQEHARAALTSHLTYEGEEPQEIAQEPFGAIVSVEPGSGAIKTLAVGPREYGTCEEVRRGDENYWTDEQGRVLCHRSTLNPAVPKGGGTGRQPGSSFKPFVVSAALESGLPPGWQVEATGPQRIPGCLNNGAPWRVNNSGGNGLRDMYTGIKGSSNVFHALLMAEVGPEKVAEVATRLGIRASTLDAVCALALGSGEVYPLEMASAYATIANYGEWCAPYAITRIEDASGRVLYEHTPRCEQVLDADIATRVIDIMQGPVTSGGTAPVANLGRWPTRGKTGTTQDYRDAWFVGYVKQLATAAWIGYPNGVVTYDCTVNASRCEAVDADCYEVNAATNTRGCVETQFLRNTRIAGRYWSRVFGGSIPAPMWKAYMAPVVENFEPEGWSRPGPMPYATVPDLLTAGSASEAESIAERAKLHLKITEVDHWKPAGTFVNQTPAAGARVPAGNLVILEVSNGSQTPPTVPNVVGMERKAAEQTLHNAGYEVSVTFLDVQDKDRNGRVVAQSPNGGSVLPPEDGAKVVIQVGRYVKPEPAPDPPDPLLPGPGNGGGNGGDGGG